MKCEPAAYTIADLERDGATSWEGVRNYQARNMLRGEMQAGDAVLFYASNAEPSGVTGLARIARGGYPDHTAWTKGHKYFDETSSKASPTWYMVDIEFVERALKMHKMTIRLTYDLIAAVETERVNFRAGTRRFLRLSVANGSNYAIDIDMCGNILEPPTTGADEETETREVTYVSAYDATWTKAWSIAVKNTLASLP